MPTILRFLDDGTAELRRAFECSPEIQSLATGALPLPAYRRLLEKLRRGFAVVELFAFEDLPEALHTKLKAHRSTWRLSHDIGLLGGLAPLPARPEDLENAGPISSWSAKLGAHFALAAVLEAMGRAQGRIAEQFGAALVACLAFNGAAPRGQARTSELVRQILDQHGPELDWAEALTAARRTFRTLRHALVEGRR